MGLSLSSFFADWNFGMDVLLMFTLAILVGVFIALGAVFATTAAAGATGAVP